MSTEAVKASKTKNKISHKKISHKDGVVIDITQQSYTKYLHEKFSKSEDYMGFKALIGEELESRYGILDWAYSMLNLPDRLTILENFGTVDTNYVNEYLDQQLYKHDLLLHHVKLNNSPRFQSDIITALEQSSFETYDITPYKKFYASNIRFGFGDICCIPITSSIDGNRCLLSLTSKGISTKTFKMTTVRSMDKLTALAVAINDIGLKLHQNEFLSPLKRFNLVSCSQPLNLLATMVKYDLGIADGAKRLGISYNTAKNHIVTIKRSLGATTIHGAHEIAAKHGFLD